MTAFSLAAEGIDDLESLATFLRTEHSAKDITDQGAPATPRVCEIIEPDEQWGSHRIAAVNNVVNDLIMEFCNRPFRHRTEHTLHCELYERLRQIPEIRNGRIALEGDRDTDIVHKEWPESGVRPDKKGRGNFDVAILTPRTAPVEEECFRRGYIKPYFAFELGLDYSADHLLNDILKLQYHAIPRSYAIHCARSHAADQERVEELVADFEQRGHIGCDNWPQLAIVILKSDTDPYIRLPT